MAGIKLVGVTKPFLLNQSSNALPSREERTAGLNPDPFPLNQIDLSKAPLTPSSLKQAKAGHENDP